MNFSNKTKNSYEILENIQSRQNIVLKNQNVTNECDSNGLDREKDAGNLAKYKLGSFDYFFYLVLEKLFYKDTADASVKNKFFKYYIFILLVTIYTMSISHDAIFFFDVFSLICEVFTSKNCDSYSYLYLFLGFNAAIFSHVLFHYPIIRSKHHKGFLFIIAFIFLNVLPGIWLELNYNTWLLNDYFHDNQIVSSFRKWRKSFNKI